ALLVEGVVLEGVGVELGDRRVEVVERLRRLRHLGLQVVEAGGALQGGAERGERAGGGLHVLDVARGVPGRRRGGGGARLRRRHRRHRGGGGGRGRGGPRAGGVLRAADLEAQRLGLRLRLLADAVDLGRGGLDD